MFNIFILIYLFTFIICEDLSSWEYEESVIYSFENSYMKSLTYFPSISHHYITYISGSYNYLHNIELEKRTNLPDESFLLSPVSVSINDIMFLLLSENTNKIYYYFLADVIYYIDYSEKNLTRLKGMEFPNSNTCLISLIGTNYIQYYNSIKENNEYLLRLNKTFTCDFKIISFYGVSGNSSSGNVYLYSYINETATVYSIYKFSDAEFTESSKFILFGNKLYNITEISKSMDNEYSLLIFTYNKNDTNFFFYYFDCYDSNVKLYSFGNKYNFWPFRDAKIINAFFLKNTEYLYYLIKKGNYYNAGVLDMENNLIVFNIQKDFIEFISVHDYNLVYGINDTIYMVCPFNSKYPDICISSLSTDNYIRISRDYINTYSSTCSTWSNYIIGRNCLRYIPLGYEAQKFYYISKCIYFDIDLLECVDVCDENKIYDSVNKICYSCEHFNQYKNTELNECVDDCSIYGLYSNSEKYICEDCNSSGYYMQNGICVEKCDSYYVIDDINMVCINCQNDTIDTPFYQDNECVKECDKNYIVDNLKKICTKCPKSKPYNQENICVKDCNEYYIKDNLSCYNCTNKFGEDYYFFNGTCVHNCPKYTLKDDINKLCYTCEEKYSKSHYYQDGVCVDDCSEFYIKYITNKACLKCNDIMENSFFEDDTCVQQCKKYYAVDNNSMACINCSKYNNSFLQNNKCVDKCSPGYVNNSYPAYVCYNCYTTNKQYEFNGVCIDNCPNNTLVNIKDHYCYSCDDGLFFDLKTKKCVKNCEKYNEIDNDNFTCKDCLYFNLFYNNITKKCVEKCPNGTALINNICEKCDIYDEEHERCLNKCPSGKYPSYLENKNNSYCFNCFCGFGNCLPNYNNLFVKENNLDNSYTCECPNNINYFINGKYCQYKEYIKNVDIIRITPIQNTIHIHKRNIFTFEMIDNKNKEIFNSLRYLLDLHEQNKNRRIKNKFMWTLNQNVIKQNNYFLIIEPDMLEDNYENQIKLTISDMRDKIITESELFIKTRSINMNNYNIKISNISGFYPMTEKLSPKILVEDVNELNNNYILNYKYITNDGEEFSLTGYILNNYNYREMIIPSSEKIKIEIKNDYNDIAFKEFNISFEKLQNYNKTLSDILKNYIYKNEIGDMRHLLNELKNFFVECKSFEFSKEKQYIYITLNITEKYLPLTIKYENNIINNITLNEDKKYEIIESNYFISLLNQIVLFIFELDIDENSKNDIYIKVINIINISLNNYIITSLSEETMISLFRTIDNLLTIMNKNNIIKDKYYTLFDNLILLKNIISNSTVSGVKLTIKGKNFNINLVKPSYNLEEFSIEKYPRQNILRNTMEDVEFLKYKDYKIEYNVIMSEKFRCNQESFLCISRLNYDFLYDELTYLKNIKIQNLMISITQFFGNNIILSKLNNNINAPKNILNYSIIIHIEDSSNNRLLKGLKYFRYNLTYDFPMEYEKNKSDIACIALNSIIDENNDISISEEENCNTYFDMKKNKIICDCNIDGEVLILLDNKLSSISKKIQFTNHNIKLINSLSGSIILSTLALISIFSIVLIRCDSYEDKLNKKFESENKNKKVKIEYKYFKDLKDTSISIFALHLTYYKYSFLNIMSMYSFDYPRFIRFNLEIVKILLNLLLSIYPYYNQPFIEKNDIINERNINPKDIKNLPTSFTEQLLSFLYSLIASIIIWFVVQIFIKILEYRKIRKMIWKPKKQILKDYAYHSIKKYPNFNKKFSSIRKAMTAYVKLCGKNLLSKKNKDKYLLYLEEKNTQKKKVNIRTNNNINTRTELAILPNNHSLEEKFLEVEEKNTSFSNISDVSKKHNHDSISLNQNLNLNIIKENDFSIIFNTSIEQLSNNTIHNLEMIKNRYITNVNKSKENNSYSNSNVVKYIDLDLQSLKNLSYIPSNKIYKNQIISIDNKSKLFMTKLVNLILFFILFVVNIFIIIVFNNIYEEYENHIISIWLIPVMIQITIINFFINYFISLFCSILLFKYYGKRKKNNCFTFVFYLFIEKYMIYFYKIRMLINKYSYQFKHI